MSGVRFTDSDAGDDGGGVVSAVVDMKGDGDGVWFEIS